ncbi:hypothetical protein NGF19_07815 [Streptomyces sp. RY43-2]|uniref:Uncharacterized protein n=1 Tax=Streptomyces macrolidinus TaxID=2952607 RepID=A0ABT0ZAA5_9ACTN|nr:hypothetical protein [Streptomyces macrolidinus]MCN9240703.1 hypothetical protein [Streptomyces macrolidinus]
MRPPTDEEKKQAASSASIHAAGDDLVPWCQTKASGHGYMNRTEACLKDLGSADLIFLSADPDDPPLGIATFYFEQRIKAYPTKAESGSDFAEFDQQLIVTPSHIDSALQGVNLYWKLGTSCSTTCDVSPVRWEHFGGGIDDGRWASGEEGATATQTANSTVRWTGTGKETIDLSWSVTGEVDVSELRASADFGNSGVESVRELAPRCDNIVKGSAPGCVLPFFKPDYTVDTNLYPAAGAYYWYMQQVMPDHAGSKRWDSLMHYLGPDTPLKNSSGGTWTSTNSRDRVCDSTWSVHPSDASVGSVDCDEYAMASTHESGGYPNSVNLVTSGSECAQLLTDKMGDGSANFGILADTRTATKGPSGKERCGRAAIPSTQNQEAFHLFPAPRWRMLDGDGFFVTLPGFEHCTSTATTCAWRKIG